MNEKSGRVILNDYLKSPDKLKTYARVVSSFDSYLKKALYFYPVLDIQKCKKLLNEINNEINYYKLDDDIIF